MKKTIEWFDIRKYFNKNMMLLLKRKDKKEYRFIADMEIKIYRFDKKGDKWKSKKLATMEFDMCEVESFCKRRIDDVLKKIKKDE